MAKFPKNFTNPAEVTICFVKGSFECLLPHLNTMYINKPTWNVKGGKGISLGTSDHVGNLVHYTLLSQILSSMLALG